MISKTKTIASEAALILAAGLIFALAANALSPRGLSLTRDYFPKPAGAAPTLAAAEQARDRAPAAAPDGATSARLREKGLQAAAHDEVVRWHREPGYTEGRIVFIDARNAERYRAGHIPGAFHLNYYRADDILPTLLPVCFAAEKIVVYCSGGECDDSELAAVLLREAGVPAENIFVYLEGIAGWKTARLPLEAGEQHSGLLAPP